MVSQNDKEKVSVSGLENFGLLFGGIADLFVPGPGTIH